MEVYGKTLKQIRESLLLTQVNMSREIMSQSNYSKVEKGEIDIPFSKMIDLLNRLGMSVDEFLYIHRDYTKNPGNQLKRLRQLSAGDKESILKNIDELKKIKNSSQRERELLSIFEALLLVLNNDYNAASEKVLQIWNRLEKHDNWYLYDIQLINSILYLFPLDVAESIVDLSLKRLKNYKNFRNINQLSANLRINFLLLLIDNKKYSKALNQTEKLISFCMDKKLYVHLGTCYIRKGILLNNLGREESSLWYEKGFGLLKEGNNEGLVQELKNEIKHYTNR
jgi:Rgg/GadR/MutR family transcriptional activator